MENTKATETISHQRWLINSGFANEMLNDNLYLFGTYLHPGIQEALVSIDVDKKFVTYRIYVTRDLFNDFNKYKKLLDLSGKWNAIKLKRLWKKHFEHKKDPARLDIDLIINSHVKELCGRNWNTSVNILSLSEYEKDIKTFQNEAEQNSASPDREPDK